MTAGVDGFADNDVGDTVCTSGAYSGEICGLEITSTDVTWPVDYGDVESLVTGIEVTNPNGANAAGQGDSGGPIYSYVNAGLVAARGTISTGDPDSPAPCTGVLYGGNAPRLSGGPDIEEVLNSPFMPTTILNNEP